jgi:hypothetical protein
LYKTVLVLLALAILAAACGSPSPTSDETAKLVPASALSPELRQLSPEVQEAYRFALANRDVLEKIPCYCGCGSIGHMNNYMCYVRSGSANGPVVFDYHAAGSGVCIDITRDAILSGYRTTRAMEELICVSRDWLPALPQPFD